MRINVIRSSMPTFEEYTEAIKPLWDSVWLTNMGKNHEELAKRLCEYLKVPNVSLFVNGHMALEMVLQAMELEGEVITTPFTFASTTHAIVRNGLTPVFCDIDRNNYTIDASKIEELITPLTSDMDCYRGRFDSSLTPIAKQTADRALTLPMSASLRLEDVDRICNIIRSCGRA